MTPLENINYCTIQGSHDSDIPSFYGLNQFDRVKFTGANDWFKSAVYVYAANHGQFNTIWGNFDVGEGLVKRLVNTSAAWTPPTSGALPRFIFRRFWIARCATSPNIGNCFRIVDMRQLAPHHRLLYAVRRLEHEAALHVRRGS